MWGRGSMLNEMIKGRLTEVMFEQRQEQSKRPNYTATWGKRITDSKCKDPDSETFPWCLEKTKEAGELGVK